MLWNLSAPRDIEPFQYALPLKNEYDLGYYWLELTEINFSSTLACVCKGLDPVSISLWSMVRLIIMGAPILLWWTPYTTLRLHQILFYKVHKWRNW